MALGRSGHCAGHRRGHLDILDHNRAMVTQR
jgi:hypothetical protein